MRKNAPQHNIKDDQARTTQICKECKDKPKIETLLLIASKETNTFSNITKIDSKGQIRWVRNFDEGFLFWNKKKTSLTLLFLSVCLFVFACLRERKFKI